MGILDSFGRDSPYGAFIFGVSVGICIGDSMRVKEIRLLFSEEEYIFVCFGASILNGFGHRDCFMPDNILSK